MSDTSGDKQGVSGATLMGNIGVELQQNALIAFLLARKLDLNLRCHFMFAAKYIAQKLPTWNHNNQ